MYCWWPVFMLFLQRMMKLVSWTACWRRCSPVLPSDGREAHGQQVLRYTQNIKSTNVSKYVHDTWILLNVFLVFFAIRHTYRTWGLSSSLSSDSVSVSTQQQICLCSLSVFHLLHGSQTELCFSFSHGYRGQSWFQQWLVIQQVKRERVPRVGAGSMKRSHWWGVVVGLEDIEGILM